MTITYLRPPPDSVLARLQRQRTELDLARRRADMLEREIELTLGELEHSMERSSDPSRLGRAP